MKKIIMVRHARAEGKKAGESDLARPLTKSGKETFSETAPKVVALFGSNCILYMSPALRAKETADILTKSGTPGPDFIIKSKELYTGPADRILGVIQASPAECDTVILVGHNPLISQVAGLLGATGVEFATGMALTMTFEADLSWREVIHSEGNVHSVLP